MPVVPIPQIVNPTKRSNRLAFIEKCSLKLSITLSGQTPSQRVDSLRRISFLLKGPYE